MKKQNLFNDENVLSRMEMNTINGGAAAGNSSDKWFGPTDSKQDGGGYDVIVNSVKDIINSSDAVDKPSVVQPYQPYYPGTATSVTAVEVL